MLCFDSHALSWKVDVLMCLNIEHAKHQEAPSTCPAAAPITPLIDSTPTCPWLMCVSVPLPPSLASACSHGYLTFRTAVLIHNTLVAMLVTGSHVPPARLHTIKTALHPEFAERLLCQDPDCLLQQSGCKGNRFEVHKSEGGGEHAGPSSSAPAAAAAGGEEVVVRYIAPHHKNDRRGSNQVLSYDLPAGPLTQLMLIHIREGHGVMTHTYKHAQPHLFMSGSGMAFTDVMFANWWHGFYHSHKGPLPYFPPSKGRTLYVENFIASTGHQPQESWEGAALAMGNSVKQWHEFYAPRMRHRLAQEAVHRHQQWREGLLADEQQQPASAPGGVRATHPHAFAQHASAPSTSAPPAGVPEPVQAGRAAVKPEQEEDAELCAPPSPSPSFSFLGIKREVIDSSPSLASSGLKKRVKVEQPSSLAPSAPSSCITPQYADEEEDAPGCTSTPSSSGWGADECMGEDGDEVAEAKPPPPAAGAPWGMDWEGGDDDGVFITRVVPPGGRSGACACGENMIDLTALSSSDEDDDEE